MKPITNPAELRHRGMEILIREMGYVNAIRFMLQFDSGFGDYTKERDALLAGWSVEDIAREGARIARTSE